MTGSTALVGKSRRSLMTAVDGITADGCVIFSCSITDGVIGIRPGLLSEIHRSAAPTLFEYNFCLIFSSYFSVFLSLFGDRFCTSWYMNRKFTISVTSITLILPMCFPKRIDFLKYFR